MISTWTITCTPGTSGHLPGALIHQLPLMGVDEGLLSVLIWDGDVSQHDMLVLLVSQDEVWVQLASTVWDGATDGHGPG